MLPPCCLGDLVSVSLRLRDVESVQKDGNFHPAYHDGFPDVRRAARAGIDPHRENHSAAFTAQSTGTFHRITA
jgi:hypothetical protein